jgi:alkylation response protein AidB-like acyl-CoA dehydrogenase
MAQILADRRDIDFVLFEQLKIEEFTKHKQYAEFNRKAVELLVTEARNLATKEILPTQADGDRIGVRFDNGAVKVPESFHKAWKALRNGEWMAMTETPEWGGQGVPRTAALAATEYLMDASFAFMMYAGLTHGAAKMIEALGNEKQKKLYLKKLFSGEWAGTMLLTESGAGSDVGALTTTATPNPDGTYSIVGNKIFISGGEHDLTSNIIHPVLARIEGAPVGTSGISLFLVPKLWVNDDGSLGERNDVVCTGIEEKMGIHGSATCSIALGSKGKCRGTLLGEANKGMRAMFMMMNEARFLVGNQGLSCASPAYLYAVNYARQRVQGRNILRFLEKSAPAVPIIQHPDIRRMLMNMKIYVESLRSLSYFLASCMDRIVLATDAEEKTRLQGIIDFLIPIAKAYTTDRSFEVCSLGMQVYGGYGYIREYPMEQLLRDCRITAIYEGTNGIQAMDLLGRKLGQNMGKPIQDLGEEIRKTIADAKNVERTAGLADKLEAAVLRLEEVARQLGMTAMYGDLLTAFAHASPFLEVCGDILVGWMLLWRARIAAEALAACAKDKDTAFYEGQVKGGEHFFNTLLPVTLGKMDAILSVSTIVNDMPEDAFGGK